MLEREERRRGKLTWESADNSESERG